MREDVFAPVTDKFRSEEPWSRKSFWVSLLYDVIFSQTLVTCLVKIIYIWEIIHLYLPHTEKILESILFCWLTNKIKFKKKMLSNVYIWVYFIFDMYYYLCCLCNMKIIVFQPIVLFRKLKKIIYKNYSSLF